MQPNAPLAGVNRFAHNVSRACGLAWRASPRLASATITLVIVQSLLPLLALYLVKLIVDAIAAALTASPPIGVPAMQPVFMLIGAAAAVALVAALVNSVSGVVGEAQAQFVTDHVQDVMHAKSIEVDLAYYENSQYYDTL